MTILVTGATGTVGSEIVKQLSSTSGKVRAAVHSVRKAEYIKHSGVELVEIDYKKPETITAALRGIEKLFLLSPFVPEMVEISSMVISEAKKAGINHIVKLSAMGAEDPNAIVTVARLHRQVELDIERSGMSYTFLRPNFFMQNFVTSLSNTIKNQDAFYMPTEDGKASYVDVRDIASVAVRTITEDSKHHGKAYTITGQETLSHYQTAEILSNVVGKKVTYVNISESEAQKGLEATGMSKWLVDSMMELNKFMREGHASKITDTVEKVTGNKPISFKEFVQDNIVYFK